MTQKKRKIKLASRIAESLDLPYEALDSALKVSMFNNEYVLVENYSGVYELFEQNIRVLTDIGIVSVTGEGLVLKELSVERLYITGIIKGIELE